MQYRACQEPFQSGFLEKVPDTFSLPLLSTFCLDSTPPLHSRPWPLLSLGVVYPLFLRDWLYARIARNRDALFGRRDSCLMPTPEVRRHFLP